MANCVFPCCVLGALSWSSRHLALRCALYSGHFGGCWAAEWLCLSCQSAHWQGLMLIMPVWCEHWGGQRGLWRCWRSTTKYSWTHLVSIRAISGFRKLRSSVKTILRPACHACWTLCEGVSCERQSRGWEEVTTAEGCPTDVGEGGGDYRLTVRCNDANNPRNSKTQTRRGKDVRASLDGVIYKGRGGRRNRPSDCPVLPIISNHFQSKWANVLSSSHIGCNVDVEQLFCCQGGQLTSQHPHPIHFCCVQPLSSNIYCHFTTAVE